MILSFRCPPRLKERIDGLIQAGLYPEFSAFCVVALENQLLLEEAQAPQQSGGRGVKESSGTGKTRKAESPRAAARLTTTQVASAQGTPVLPASKSSPAVPAALNLGSIPAGPPFALIESSTDVFHPNDVISVDRWLFGQYNRLLPAKVSIRALVAIASAEGKEALILDSVAPRIAEIAAQVGDYLRSLDKKFGTHRDEALATAFPEGDSEDQKGRVRYQNHFVGHTVRGEQGGLLVSLKLATIRVIKNKPHILPTSVGWKFALLPNTLLDDNTSDHTHKLGQVEKEFLLGHIRENVPVELFAYRVLLTLVSRDVCSPNTINEALYSLLSRSRSVSDSKEFVNTQRAGVLGRMMDLGLVSLERDGRYISRTLTEEGKKFLEEVGTVDIPAHV